MQNIVVIGRVYSKLEHSEFSSNFEFDRNMLSGTGAWCHKHRNATWQFDMLAWNLISLFLNSGEFNMYKLKKIKINKKHILLTRQM